jgi:hypothetical protein
LTKNSLGLEKNEIINMIYAVTVIVYPLVSGLSVSIFLCTILFLLCNLGIKFPSFRKTSEFILFVAPIFLLSCAFFTPVFGKFHEVLGGLSAPLQQEYTNEYLAGYLYLAFGFGFSIINIRQKYTNFKIMGIIFLIIFTIFIFSNLRLIIDLWQHINKVAEQRGY